MFRYLKDNSQFIIILVMWVLVGVYVPPLSYAFIPFIAYLFFRKGMYQEMFIGFWFILILSDNLLPSTEFAKGVKNIYALFLASVVILRKENFTPVRTFYQRFIPFFLIAFIALYSSVTLAIGFQKTISYLLLFIMVPNYVGVIYRERKDYFFKDIVYFFSIILLIGIFMKYFFPDIAISHNGRLSGIFGNPNGLGIFSVLCFMLFFIIDNIRPLLFSKWDKRLIYFLIIASVIFSGSRNSAVSILIFLISARFYKVSPFLGFVFVVIAALGSELIGNNYIAIIQALGLEGFFRVNTLDEAGGRYIAWNFAWQQIQNNFFLGKGFAFDEYIMRKNFDMLSKLGHQGGVHNSYLILWLNTGLIGLLVYLVTFIGTFYQAAKNSRLAFPVMYAVMFTAMFEPWLVSSLNPFTIILLIIISLMLYPPIDEDENIIQADI